MHLGIFKVCVLLVTTIVNHPLLFPNDSETLPVTDEALIQRLQVYEENLKIQKQQLLGKQMTSNETRQETSKLWILTSVFLLLLFQILRNDFVNDHSEEDVFQMENILEDLPNTTTLAVFYDHCVYRTIYDAARTGMFVEWFADDLLEAMRSVCNSNADMDVKDTMCVVNTSENWRLTGPSECDLIVPFVPPEPFQFKCQPWVTDQSTKRGYGTIRVCGLDDKTSSFHPLHSQNIPNNDKDMIMSVSKNSYLATDQVMKWFQTTVRKAWKKISHKHQFDLSFRTLDCPGALRVKFQSGTMMNFNVTPVVQYEDSDLYFVSRMPEPQGIYWDISFAVYEKRFLREVAKHLPDHSCHLSCLQIITFIYSKQCDISGQAGLTTYHINTVFLHLLLALPSCDWDSGNLNDRLKDMFKQLEKCLLEKKLNHFMVGNPDLPETVTIPEVFRLAAPLNLFHPFVLDKDLYKSTVTMFYEMLKNMNYFVNEYIPV